MSEPSGHLYFDTLDWNSTKNEAPIAGSNPYLFTVHVERQHSGGMKSSWVLLPALLKVFKLVEKRLYVHTAKN
jgi:hypothetical protein